MEKPKVIVLAAMLSLFALSGCSLKYTKFEQTLDGNQMDFSDIKNMKSGKSCLGIFSNDNSLATAAKNGDITEVHFVEKELAGIFLSTNCTIAYGK